MGWAPQNCNFIWGKGWLTIKIWGALFSHKLEQRAPFWKKWVWSLNSQAQVVYLTVCQPADHCSRTPPKSSAALAAPIHWALCGRKAPGQNGPLPTWQRWKIGWLWPPGPLVHHQWPWKAPFGRWKPGSRCSADCQLTFNPVWNLELYGCTWYFYIPMKRHREWGRRNKWIKDNKGMKEPTNEQTNGGKAGNGREWKGMEGNGMKRNGLQWNRMTLKFIYLYIQYHEMKRTETKQYVYNCVYIYMCVCDCVCVSSHSLPVGPRLPQKNRPWESGRTPKEHAWTLAHATQKRLASLCI